MEQTSTMTVNITRGTVQNGTGNTIFSNDKGVLQINGLTVSDSSNTVRTSCCCCSKSERFSVQKVNRFSRHI